MSNMKPEIRFGEFADAWEKRKLGSITESFSGGTPSSGNSEYYGGSIPFIRSGEISLNITELFVTEAGLNNSSAKMVKEGDILYALYGATSGEVSISKINGAINQAILAIRSINNDDHYLIAQWLRMQKKRIISTYLQGGQGNLSGSIVKELEITLPINKDEQKLISSLFYTLDNLITLHQRKLDKMKNLKSAYLSKMFPKEGEKYPRLRFAGFTDAWEQRKLGDFGRATGGTSIESEFSEDGIYKVISIGSYSENSVYTDQGIRAIDSEKTRKRILNKGDLTMILNDKTASGNIIGRVLFIEKSGLYVYNQRTERIEVDAEKYDSIFIYQMLNAPKIREKIIKQSQGNTQIYVNWPKISHTEYMVPKIDEQRKIGEYFQQLDNLITLHQRKLEKLKQLKQAMLQKMFV